MNIYIKQNNTIQEIEVKDNWLDEKPEGIEDHAYLCERYIKTLGKNVRSQYSESLLEEFTAQELTEAKETKIKELETYHDSTEVKEMTINNYYNLSLNSKGRALIDEQIQHLSQKIAKGALTQETAIFNYAYNGGSVAITIEQLESLYIFMLDTVNANFAVYKTHSFAINALTSVDEVESYDFTANYIKNQNLDIA